MVHGKVSSRCKPPTSMQEPAIAQAFDVKEPSFSEETVVEEPAPAEEAARERLATQEGVVPLSPRLGQLSLLVQPIAVVISTNHRHTWWCQN